jgi:uncharacterized protein YcaQ
MKHWDFAQNFCKILQPQSEGCGMKKKTNVWLMRWLKDTRHPQKLSADLRDMAHFYFFQNVELMVPRGLYATLNSILNIFKL